MTTLPFLTTGELQDQGGGSIFGAEDVPLTVWPARASSSPQGRTYTHEGEAHLDFAEDLQVPNRQLVVDGLTYKIVNAQPQQFVPHVALELRRVEGNG